MSGDPVATPERTGEADAAGVPSAPKRAQWGLALRIVSGLVFVPLLILLARAGGLAWLGFVALQTGLGLEEFYRMARAKGLAPVRWLGFASAMALLGLAYRPHTPNASLLTTGALLVLLALALRRAGQQRQDRPGHHQQPGDQKPSLETCGENRRTCGEALGRDHRPARCCSALP